jgi:hypothetical protein
MPTVNVTYPNGGEVWYIIDDQCVKYGWCRDWCRDWCVAHGMDDKCQYGITWSAKSNGADPDSALGIDIWYSVDSGQNWLAKIAAQVTNSGKFSWKIPYNSRYVSEKGRIKVVATDKNDSSIWNWDQSDADFCPPLLSLDDLISQSLGIQLALVDLSLVPMTVDDIGNEIAQTNNATTTADVVVAQTDVGVAAIENSSADNSDAVTVVTDPVDANATSTAALSDSIGP